VLLVRILILVVLLLIFVQDLLSRSVYWIVFPVLTILLIVARVVLHQSLPEIWQSVLINCGFLAAQLLLVSAWFSFKQGRWVNIMSHLLGWGDVLFLLCITFYLSVLNFLAFYIVSLMGVLAFWLVGQMLISKKNRHIPLAGFQAILFAVFLINSWWLMPIDLMNDDWLLHFIIK
jgi:hypothetical protein